jgi:hypothetical protein
MIITLCGSARFEPWYLAWNEALSFSGRAVFSLASLDHYQGMSGYSLEEKQVLDEVQRLKIRASDGIAVLNVFAYIGDSTLEAIRYARAEGKQTYFLESWGEGNGIGRGHFAHVQATRDVYGVPREYGSPISTVMDHRRPSIWDLLPGAGEMRTAIVARLRRRLEPVAGGWGA